MLWFDHSVWFMINNLPKFFPNSTYPSLSSKYGAFLTWMKGAAKLAVKQQITFIAIRRLMDTAALEFATDPLQKLLSKHYEAPGARKVERLFKPASFSLEVSAPTPPQKRRRLNINVSANEVPPAQRRTPPSYPNRNRGGGRSGGGCGNYNRNYRSPGGFQIFGSNHRSTENSPSMSTRSEFQRTDQTFATTSSGDSRPKTQTSHPGAYLKLG